MSRPSRPSSTRAPLPRLHRRALTLSLATTLLSLPTPATAGIVLPSLPPGTQYQLVFVTANGRDATSANIAHYNTFVTQEAALNPSLPSATWRAVASTPTVHARDNAPTFPTIPIYNTAGQLVANGTGDFWFPAHLAAINYDQYGIKENGQAWTGTQTNGMAASPLGGGAGVMIGWIHQYTNAEWVRSYAAAATAIVPLYALSSVLTATGPSISATWSARTGGDWSNPANWTSSIPGGAGAEAYFAGTITSPQTVYTNAPITLGKLRFNSPHTYVLSGAGSLTLQNPGAPAVVQVDAGTHKLNLPLSLASNTTLSVAAGAHLLLADPVTLAPNVTVTHAGPGTVTYQSTLTLQSNASLTLTAPTHLASLDLAATATLDVADNALTVLADPHADARLLPAIRQYLSTGQLRSSTPDPADTRSLAYRPAGPTLLVQLTLTGDANLDGTLNQDDYALLDKGFASGGAFWWDGDFTYDGQVDANDYLALDRAYLSTKAQANLPGDLLSQRAAQFGPAYVSTLLTSIPEPTPLLSALCSLLSLALLPRRQPAHHRIP